MRLYAIAPTIIIFRASICIQLGIDLWGIERERELPCSHHASNNPEERPHPIELEEVWSRSTKINVVGSIFSLVHPFSRYTVSNIPKILILFIQNRDIPNERQKKKRGGKRLERWPPRLAIWLTGGLKKPMICVQLASTSIPWSKLVLRLGFYKLRR